MNSELELKNEMVRFNLRVPTKISDMVRKYSDNLGVPYNTGYILLLNKALEQDNQINVLNELLLTLKNDTTKNRERTISNFFKNIDNQ